VSARVWGFLTICPLIFSKSLSFSLDHWAVKDLITFQAVLVLSADLDISALQCNFLANWMVLVKI